MVRIVSRNTVLGWMIKGTTAQKKVYVSPFQASVCATSALPGLLVKHKCSGAQTVGLHSECAQRCAAVMVIVTQTLVSVNVPKASQGKTVLETSVQANAADMASATQHVLDVNATSCGMVTTVRRVNVLSTVNRHTASV